MNIHYSPLDWTNTDTKHNNNKKIAENKQTEETSNEEISFFFYNFDVWNYYRF